MKNISIQVVTIINDLNPVKKSKGILITGKPGTGKTSLALRIAGNDNNNNINEKKSKGKVFIIGLSNRIGAINKTLCRPGRLDRTYELIIKKPEQRRKILEILTKEFIEFGISPPRGILIYGPSGVGKTMLCRAIAAETGLNFMFVECSQIRSKIVGESEKNISKIFSQAKSNSPCILFIDQVYILTPARGGTNNMTTTENTSERIVTSLLIEPEVDVLVISTTNRPEVLDPALLRPGRLDQHIYIPSPDSKQRNSILKGKFKKMPIILSEQQLSSMVQVTEGFSGADLDNLCREAALISIRENINNERQDPFVKHLY
ncbi:7583_t:CDS:10 [Diversispora eburnea]|uniref:7583_t:CDS:1 n=1 Tax=Diversispora eburnea TaxID=1213867 RepID=A0A9N8ZH87_9GLOM|nr:7583_t:CDS:10 [Diversispora eburnea]